MLLLIGSHESQVELWGEAWRVNPASCIVGTEYGMSLTNAQRPRDAIPVLWDSHRRELESGWFIDTIQSIRGDVKEDHRFAQWQRMANLLQTRCAIVLFTCLLVNCFLV